MSSDFFELGSYSQVLVHKDRTRARVILQAKVRERDSLMPRRDLLKVLEMIFHYMQLISISQALLKDST